jgi:hypothetical protein
MAEEKPAPPEGGSHSDDTDVPKRIRFHYLKSNAFRTIHADGVFGGVTPRLDIAATFFNERVPLPDQTVQSINDDGTAGDEIFEERIVRDGLVRELEANIIMDVAFAKTLVKWLSDKITFIEQKIEEVNQNKAQATNEDADAVAG